MSTTTTENTVASDHKGLVATLLGLSPSERIDFYKSAFEQDQLLTDTFVNLNGGLLVQREEVNAERAQELLDMNYGYQRDFKHNAIELYTSEMLSINPETGESRWNRDSLIQLVRCAEDGREYLVDGQNRLSAIIASETTQPMLIHRIQVDTLEEVLRIYTNIDSGVKRSSNDKLKALFFGHDGDLKKLVKGKTVNGEKQPDTLVPDTGKLTHVQTALKLWFNAGYGVSARTRIPIPMDKVKHCIIQFEPFAAQLYDAIVGSEIEHKMDSSPVMAMALLTIAHKAEWAVKFWSNVAKKPEVPNLFNQEVLEQQSAAVQLHQFILNHNVDELKTGVMLRVIARAWNAFNGRTTVAALGGLNANDPAVQADQPIKVGGTPYDGKHRVYLELDGTFRVAPLEDPQIEIDRQEKELKLQQKAEKKAAREKATAEKKANKVPGKRGPKSGTVALRGHAAQTTIEDALGETGTPNTSADGDESTVVEGEAAAE